MRTSHVGSDIIPRPLLRFGDREAKRTQKWLQKSLIPNAYQRLSVGLECLTPIADLSLKQYEILQRQPLAGHLDSFNFVGEMHRLERLGQRQPIAIVTDEEAVVRVRHQPGELIHHLPQDSPQPSLFDTVGQPIDRDDAL